MGSASLSVREGDVLAGKYRIERIIGQGGMGVVVAAQHLQLDERVALKFLLSESLQHPEVVARFAREGKAAAKIRSEHVARVKDVGTLETGAPYLVLEYLDGVDLSAHLKRSGPLPLAEAVDFVLQASEAIAEAHSLGIIHRDLKPANLFLTRRADGSVCIKVLDFGISKMSQAADTGGDMTKTSAMMGSPFYMSPEQMTAAKSVAPQADIWALGVILFELLTGQKPFDGESIAHLCIVIATQPPVPLHTLRPDLPPAIEAIIGRCLAKQPSARFASTAELAEALAPFAPGSGLSVERIRRIVNPGAPSLGAPAPVTASTTAMAPTAVAPTPGPAATAGAWGSTGAATSLPLDTPNKGIIVAIAAVAVVLSLGGAYMAFGRGRADGTPATALASASASAAATAPPPSAEPSVPPPPPPPPPSASAEPIASAAPSAVPSATATATATFTAAPAVAAPPSASAKPNCTPPFTVDAQGNKHFKPQCYPK